MKHTYYFEVSKEAELAETQDGDPSEAYLTASFESEETTFTEDRILNYISKLSSLPKEHLKLISKEEYEDFQEEDEEDFYD